MRSSQGDTHSTADTGNQDFIGVFSTRFPIPTDGRPVSP